MTVHINRSGVLRDIEEIHINRSGVLRDIQEVWINRSGVLRKVFDKVPTPPPLSLTWTDAVAQLRSGGKTTAPSNGFITVNHDGNVTAGVDAESLDTLTGQTWHSLYPSVEAGTATWTVRINRNGVQKPTFTTLQPETEYTLDQTRTFNFQNQQTSSEGIFNLDIIFDDKMGNVITKNVSLWMPVGVQP
jgi:hypothetical protein